MAAFHYPPVDAHSLRSGCCLTSVGSLASKPGLPYPPPGHPRDFDLPWGEGRSIPDFALVFITSGTGEWESRDEPRTEVHAGDALYLVPGGWHRYRPKPATGWMEKWICLRGPALHALVGAGALPRACKRLAGIPCPETEFNRLFDDVLAEPGRNRPSWGARALAVLLESFEKLNPVAAAPPRIDTIAEAGLRFIRENAHRAIKVGDVAEACGVQRRTLERHFEQAGMGTVARSIVAERILRAEILLRETQLQVKEIAHACGFGGAQRMIYDFQRHCGTTPGQFRQGRWPL